MKRSPVGEYSREVITSVSGSMVRKDFKLESIALKSQNLIKESYPPEISLLPEGSIIVKKFFSLLKEIVVKKNYLALAQKHVLHDLSFRLHDCKEYRMGYSHQHRNLFPV